MSHSMKGSILLPFLVFTSCSESNHENRLQRWEIDRLLFKAGAMGQNLTGFVDVFDDHVRVEMELPWILSAIAGPLRERLRKEGSLLLEAKSRGV